MPGSNIFVANASLLVSYTIPLGITWASHGHREPGKSFRRIQVPSRGHRRRFKGFACFSWSTVAILFHTEDPSFHPWICEKVLLSKRISISKENIMSLYYSCTKFIYFICHHQQGAEAGIVSCSRRLREGQC